MQLLVLRGKEVLYLACEWALEISRPITTFAQLENPIHCVYRKATLQGMFKNI